MKNLRSSFIFSIAFYIILVSADICGTGAGFRIALSIFEDRPSEEYFENSPVLQDWVTATEILVVFQ